MKRFLYIIILAPVLFGGCGDEVIEEEKFVNFYIDLVVAQDSMGTDAETTGRIIDDLTQKYELTEGDYLATLEHYNQTEKMWTAFFEKVIEKLEKMKAQAMQRP